MSEESLEVPEADAVEQATDAVPTPDEQRGLPLARCNPIGRRIELDGWPSLHRTDTLGDHSDRIATGQVA